MVLEQDVDAMTLNVSPFVMRHHQRVLAALDRKITAELAPTHEVPDDRMGVKHDENDGTENKQEQSQQPQTEVEAETTVKTVNVTPQGYKPLMIAEPQPRYPISASVPRFPARHSGI